MLFLFLTICSMVAAMICGINMPYHWSISSLLSLIIYFLLSCFTCVIVLLLSLWLGKSNQTHLKKISKYIIAEEGENHYYLEDGGAVPKSLIDTIVYDADRPYIEVRYYNVKPWMAKVLWELYDDRCEYILHSYA